MNQSNPNHPLRTVLAAALFASLALVGCKKQAETGATPAPAPASTTEPAAATSPMLVTTVDLGSAIGPDNRITVPLTTFAPTDSIHAAVGTAGGSAGTLTAKWSYEDGQVVDTTDKSVAAGEQTTEFSISKPDGWPTGRYTLEVQLDGQTVQTREFEVR